MTPTVGRIVHYVSLGSRRGEYPEGKCRAAIVTDVAEDGSSVSLRVWSPDADGTKHGVVEDPSPAPASGTWHWPERAPGQSPL